MRRTAALVLALLVGLPPAAATPRDADRPADADRRAERLAARGELRAKLAARLPRLAPAFAGSVVYSGAELVPVGDLDGDGSDELGDVRVVFEEDADGSFSEQVALYVHRGRDGKLLWRVDLADESFAFPMAAKVGPDGRRGLVVVAYRVRFVDGVAVFTVVEHTSVTSYDGTGRKLWSAGYDGAWQYAVTGFATGATYVDGLLDAVPGGGDDVLVSSVAGGWASSGLAYGSGGVVATSILDGADGSARRLTPVPSLSPEPQAAPAGDLDGDKRDDVVVAGSAGPATSVATALRSSDGSVLWASRELPAAETSRPFAVPDATGDGVGDVLVSAASWSAPPLDGPQDAAVSLLDGKSGASRWTRPGRRGYSLGGSVDRTKGAEVVVGEMEFEGRAMSQRMTAYDATGRRLWSVARELSTAGFQSGWAEIGFEMSGDTNGDRVREPMYRFRFNGNVKQFAGGTVDGRTGRVLRSPGEPTYASVLPIDGRGSDRVSVTVAKGRVAVTAWRGNAAAKLWQASFAGRGTDALVTTAYLDRDRCADVVVGTRSGTTAVDVVLSGATGRPLWVLSRSGVGAPKVTRTVSVATRRHAATC